MSIRYKKVISLICRIVAAGIMLQTLFFKFTAAPESVYIFSKLGMEPWGRIGIGILELIASILILWPRTTALGAVAGMGLMGGALFFHLTKLGVTVQGDSGLLFMYALLVFVCCFMLFVMHKSQLLHILHLFKKTEHYDQQNNRAGH